MADIKWIKITTDIFDDEKILLIESLPEADSIIVIWFKLLCLAGKMNNSGVFLLSDKIAYTDKMLATIFRRKESTVQLALKTFEQFGMIEILDGVITIPNWGKHQNLEQLEARKKYQREYQRDYRRKQKLLLTVEQEENTEESSCEDSRKHLHKYLHESNVNSLDKEKDKEEDKDKNKESKEKATCEQVVDLYRSICVSYPSVKTLSEARKKAIRARLKVYSLEDFRKMFEKAEGSAFLKGANNRNWSANFDWLMKDANFAKVKETPEQQLNLLCRLIIRERDNWNYINENSCNDPFWPDGCNMNLTRNHIISYKRDIAELCEENGMPLPEEYFLKIPPEVDDNYMANLK